MNAYDTVIELVVRRIAWSLVHFLWQGTAIAVFLQSALWFGRIRRPTTRYAMCLSALFVMVVCPVATIDWVQPQVFEGRQTLHGQWNEVVDRQGANSSDEKTRTEIASDRLSDLTVPRFDVVAPKGELGGQRIGLSDQRWWSKGIVIGWLCGVGVFTMRLLLGWIGILRICQRVEPVPEWLTDRLHILAGKLKMPSPLLRISSCLTEAVAVGIVKPMILIPIAWTTTLPPDMIEAVIVHELVHLLRRDLWVNLFQRLAETLLFYHPAIWLLSRRIRIERELCCDEQVVRTLRSSVRYAETLEQIGRLSLEPSHWNSSHTAAVTVSICGPRRVLLRRIQAILLLDPKLPAASGQIAGLATLVPAAFVLGLLVFANLLPASDQTELRQPEPKALAQEIPVDTDPAPAKQSEALPVDDDLFVVIPKGKSRAIEFKNRVVKVDGFGADMFRIAPPGTKTLRVKGSTPGLNLIICTDEFRTEFALVVEVTDIDSAKLDESPYRPQPRKRPLSRIKVSAGVNEMNVYETYSTEFEFPQRVTTVDGFDEQILHLGVSGGDSNLVLRGLAIGKTTINVNMGQFIIHIDVNSRPETRPAFRKLFENQDNPVALQQEPGQDHDDQLDLTNNLTSNELQVVPLANNDAADPIWSQLGLRLTVLPNSERSELAKTRYRGGMRVLEVKADSPSNVGGFKKDDILVGLDKWETMSIDNVKWILEELGRTPQPAGGTKFFVVRLQEIRIGNLQLPTGPHPEKLIDPSNTVPVDSNEDFEDLFDDLTEFKSADVPVTKANESLDELMNRALSATYVRQLVATAHSPWQIMHGIKAFGLNWPICKQSRSGETITAGEWIASGPKFNHEPVWYATNDGARAHPFSKPYYFEGHPGQFLAYLAAAGVPTNFQLKAFRDGVDQPVTVKVGDVVTDLKLNLDESTELSWVLWALAYYEPIDSSWIDKQGHQWTLKKLAAQEASRAIIGAPVGGCPRLFALATVLKKYRIANNPANQILPPPWNDVNTKLNQFAEKVKRSQNTDGSFSSSWFAGQELSHDMNVRLSTTGTQLAWLAVALPDKGMIEDWIERATRVLAQDLLESKSIQLEVGSMSDAAYALKLVRERRRAIADAR